MTKKRGRPEIPFDWSKLDAILQYKASFEDAAELMGVDSSTLAKKIQKEKGCNFSEYRDKKMAGVRFNLSQKAIQMALSGDRTMMIFCLKNYCGWTDVMVQEINQTMTVEDRRKIFRTVWGMTEESVSQDDVKEIGSDESSHKD